MTSHEARCSTWPRTAPGTGAARSRWWCCRSRWPRCCCSAWSACAPTCARAFRKSVSGTDLVVGARTGSVQLMLYAVFRIGGATNNIRMSSVQATRQTPRGRLGGADVAGRFAPRHAGAGHEQRLLPALSAMATARRSSSRRGGPSRRTLDGLYEAVIGAEVASALGYTLGQQVTLTPRLGRGRQPGRRTCRQALHRGRRAGAHRHAGRPHGAREPGSDRGDSPRMGRRCADAGVEDSRRAGAQVRSGAQASHRRAGGPEDPRRGVRRAAPRRRIRRRAADGGAARRRTRRTVERDRRR